MLVASGMYEGLDLVDDTARWQVVSKIPWPSLADPAMKWRANEDPDFYNWETLRQVIQACGRVCRGPDDYGVTYILDSTWNRLEREAAHLFPDWFSIT